MNLKSQMFLIKGIEVAIYLDKCLIKLPKEYDIIFLKRTIEG
jgi:hypothetical protein